MTEDSKLTVKRLVVVFWFVIAVVYGYFTFHYIRADMKDRKMDEYLQHLVNLAGNENRPLKEIRQLALLHAEELGLPIEGDDIKFHGGGRSLSITLEYEMGIDFPLIRYNVFRHYSHLVRYRTID